MPNQFAEALLWAMKKQPPSGGASATLLGSAVQDELEMARRLAEQRADTLAHFRRLLQLDRMKMPPPPPPLLQRMWRGIRRVIGRRQATRRVARSAASSSADPPDADPDPTESKLVTAGNSPRCTFVRGLFHAEKDGHPADEPDARKEIRDAATPPAKI